MNLHSCSNNYLVCSDAAGTSQHKYEVHVSKNKIDELKANMKKNDNEADCSRCLGSNNLNMLVDSNIFNEIRSSLKCIDA